MKERKRTIRMKQFELSYLAFFALAFLCFTSMNAQSDKEQKKLQKLSNEYINEAEESLSENDFASAEASYRKAISVDPANTSAKYNMGNLYYTKEKAGQAETRLKQAAEIAATKDEKHRIYHNLGNSQMKKKNYEAAVEAYKNALRNDPQDEETRYNLALAKQMLEKQQNENKDNKDNQDNKDNKDNKDQNKDNKDQQQDQKDGEGEDEKEDQKPQDKDGENDQDKKDGDQDEDKQKDEGDQQKDDKNKEGDEEKKPQQQQQQPAQGQLSPQQIKSLLEAMNNEEKKVQDKINAEKAKGVKVKSEKDW